MTNYGHSHHEAIAVKKVLLVTGSTVLLKAHVQAYTRNDGTFVKEHDDKRNRAQMDMFAHGESSEKDADNWIGAHKVFIEHTKEEFGPAMDTEPRAHSYVKNAPAGHAALETIVKPSGKKWHILYVSHGDGKASSESLGASQNGSLDDVVSKLNKKHADSQKQHSDRQRELDQISSQHKEIAKKLGLKAGFKIGVIIPNNGKQLRAAFISKDHEDGTFDVQATSGGRQYQLSRMTAASIEAAIKRAKGDT